MPHVTAVGHFSCRRRHEGVSGCIFEWLSPGGMYAWSNYAAHPTQSGRATAVGEAAGLADRRAVAHPRARRPFKRPGPRVRSCPSWICAHTAVAGSPPGRRFSTDRPDKRRSRSAGSMPATVHCSARTASKALSPAVSHSVRCASVMPLRVHSGCCAAGSGSRVVSRAGAVGIGVGEGAGTDDAAGGGAGVRTMPVGGCWPGARNRVGASTGAIEPAGALSAP